MPPAPSSMYRSPLKSSLSNLVTRELSFSLANFIASSIMSLEIFIRSKLSLENSANLTLILISLNEQRYSLPDIVWKIKALLSSSTSTVSIIDVRIDEQAKNLSSSFTGKPPNTKFSKISSTCHFANLVIYNHHLYLENTQSYQDLKRHRIPPPTRNQHLQYYCHPDTL